MTTESTVVIVAIISAITLICIASIVMMGRTGGWWRVSAKLSDLRVEIEHSRETEDAGKEAIGQKSISARPKKALQNGSTKQRTDKKRQRSNRRRSKAP
jgi:hypothetical protein